MSRYNRDQTKRDLIMAMEIGSMAKRNEQEDFVRLKDILRKRKRWVRAYSQNRSKGSIRVVVSIKNPEPVKEAVSNREFDLSSLYGQ